MLTTILPLMASCEVCLSYSLCFNHNYFICILMMKLQKLWNSCRHILCYLTVLFFLTSHNWKSISFLSYNLHLIYRYVYIINNMQKFSLVKTHYRLKFHLQQFLAINRNTFFFMFFTGPVKDFLFILQTTLWKINITQLGNP